MQNCSDLHQARALQNVKNKVLHSLEFVEDEFDSTQKDPH
jgi:hypothetical protein